MKHWLNTSAGLQEYDHVAFHSKSTNKQVFYFAGIVLDNFSNQTETVRLYPIFEKMETLHLLISGKVQGVFFRETARQLAVKLDIKGWIKNTPDGKVEALVTGDEKALNDFVDFCKAGPERAVVDEVKVSRQYETDFEKFEIIRRK